MSDDIIELTSDQAVVLSLAMKKLSYDEFHIKNYDISIHKEEDFFYVNFLNKNRPKGIRGHWGDAPEFSYQYSIDKNFIKKIYSR
jgi:hypothetical protein